LTNADQDKITIKANITSNGYIPPGPDPKPESSSNGWIIAVSVIGGLLVLGGIGFYIWKKKKE
jgi:LPXTG-motif cell wall-anchored protein